MEGQQLNPHKIQQVPAEEGKKIVDMQEIKLESIVSSPIEEDMHTESHCENLLTEQDQTNKQNSPIEKQQFFTDLKQGKSESESQREQFQTANRYIGTSHEELISIAQTNNCQTNEIQSSDTIFTEEEIEERPLERESINLTQSTPFQILQESLTTKKEQENPLPDSIFVQVHTEEIHIQNTQSATKQRQPEQNSNECKNEIEARVQQGLKLSHSIRRSRLKVEKILEVTHQPEQKKPVAIENIVTQQKVKIQEKVQEKTEKPAEKAAQEEKKPQLEPLKIDNLFISSLRSKSQIKPPQPQAGKETTKPWMKLRSKKSTTEPLMPLVSPPVVKEQTIISPSQNKGTQQPAKVQAIIQKIEALPVDASPNKQQLKQEQINEKVSEMVKQAPIVKQQIAQVIPQPKQPQIQFHSAVHHPLEGPLRPINIPIVSQEPQPNPEPLQKIEEQNAPIIEELPLLPLSQAKEQQDPLPQIQQNKEADFIVQRSSSSASSSQKQQIDINYNHNKKYQEQLHKQSRERIKQLMEKLKQQEQLNKQLQKSMSLPLRLLGSALIGASTAGITWLLRKKRSQSLVVGLAFTMSSFVFSS